MTSGLENTMEQRDLNKSIAFIQRTESLKSTLRSGHTSNGRQESTAEHTWRLCLFIMVFSGHFENADMCRLLKLAIIHDLGEAICGDVPAIAQSEINDKSIVERKAILDLCEELPDGVRQEFLALWDEYAAATTFESRIIKGLDKLETIMQHNQGKNPSDFNYGFNLSYGREYTSAIPLLEQIRAILDQETRDRAEGNRQF